MNRNSPSINEGSLENTSTVPLSVFNVNLESSFLVIYYENVCDIYTVYISAPGNKIKSKKFKSEIFKR